MALSPSTRGRFQLSPTQSRVDNSTFGSRPLLAIAVQQDAKPRSNQETGEEITWEGNENKHRLVCNLC